MIPKENKMPDISDITSASGCYLASTLAGQFQLNDYDESKKTIITRFVTLIDKAKHEYLMAREAVDNEIEEGKMSYDEIIERGEGQYMYTTTITNHLENCIITLGILFKLLEKLSEVDLQQLYSEIEAVILNESSSDTDKILDAKNNFQKINQIKEAKEKLISKKLIKIRNSIVHIEDRIISGVNGGIILSINEEGTTISLLNHKLAVADLAQAIKDLNLYIRNLL